MINLDQITGFDWDDGNSRKRADKPDVSQGEAESVFFNDPLIVAEDAKYNETERRFNALGKTARNRLLHITFTLRRYGTKGTKVRVTSARDMLRKERRTNEQA
jgi:uncharacterized protein